MFLINLLYFSILALVATVISLEEDYAEIWVKIRHSYDLPKRKYYDGNDKDDRLLYKGLCEESRKEYLLEQHEKELECRNNS